MLKRGNIPIVLFVLLVLLLFGFTLIAFSMFEDRSSKFIGGGYTHVKALNFELDWEKFSGEDKDGVVVWEEEKGWIFNKEKFERGRFSEIKR